jgi:TldD protein
VSNQYASPAAQVLDSATAAGAQYADVQFWTIHEQRMFVRNGVVRDVSDRSSVGYSVRSLVDGSWGFAGSDRFNKTGLDEAATRSVVIAKSSTRVAGRIKGVMPTGKSVISWSTPIRIDPDTVSLSKRADHLIAAEKNLHVAKNVVSGYAFMTFWITDKEFYSTNGSAIAQRLYQSGCGVGATAIGKDQDPQRRGGPGDFGLFQGAGYEVVERADLLNNASRYGTEAVQLTTAPVLPTMTTDLILHGNVLNLQMHESIGHPLELDRSLGWEANFSGISWVKPEDVGKVRYGSDKLTIYADNTLESGMATVAFDDEGAQPKRVALIENGMLRAFLSSRDTAAQTSLPETASTRAQDWASIPIVRMTNIALAPGEGTLESIIADTNDGVVVESINSWSIDDHRLNFQFGPQIAWEVKNGKRGKIYKKPTYTGITPQFWGSLDRVAGPEEVVVWGTPNCGKGEPEQAGRTTHACSHARFRNVKVGVRNNA